jgi:hypothetical protein
LGFTDASVSPRLTKLTLQKCPEIQLMIFFLLFFDFTNLNSIFCHKLKRMEPYNHTKDLFNLIIDEEAKAQLLETVRWTKFIAIIGFVFLGLLLLLAVAMGAGFSMMSEMSGMSEMRGLGGALGVGMMVMYLLIALLYFFPIYYLYKYSVLIKPAIHSGNQEQFNLALSYQRRMYKFIGVLFLIVVAIYAIMFIFMIIGGVIGSL